MPGATSLHSPACSSAGARNPITPIPATKPPSILSKASRGAPRPLRAFQALKIIIFFISRPVKSVVGGGGVGAGRGAHAGIVRRRMTSICCSAYAARRSAGVVAVSFPSLFLFSLFVLLFFILLFSLPLLFILQILPWVLVKHNSSKLQNDSQH